MAHSEGVEDLDLDLDLSFMGRRGRRAGSFDFEVLREVRASDLVAQESAEAGVVVPLKKLTARHHSVARLLAVGTSPGAAAIAVGLDNAYLSTLQNDPAFKDLVKFYSNKTEEAFFDTMQNLSDFSQEVMTELRDRLETTPEDFQVRDLTKLLTDTLDRTGHGPTSTQNTNVNINLGERLDAARQRALALRMAEAQDITPTSEGISHLPIEGKAG